MKIKKIIVLLTLVVALVGCNSIKKEPGQSTKSEAQDKKMKVGGSKTGEGNINLYGPGSNTENDGRIEVKSGFKDFHISSRNIPSETNYEIYSNAEKIDFELVGDVDTSLIVNNLNPGENFIEIIGKKNDKVIFYRELIVIMK